jgi:hypothetical protein
MYFANWCKGIKVPNLAKDCFKLVLKKVLQEILDENLMARGIGYSDVKDMYHLPPCCLALCIWLCVFFSRPGIDWYLPGTHEAQSASLVSPAPCIRSIRAHTAAQGCKSHVIKGTRSRDMNHVPPPAVSKSESVFVSVSLIRCSKGSSPSLPSKATYRIL